VALDPPTGSDPGSSPETASLIFVSDASAEAERLTTALRGRGYGVVDVPLTLLLSRASVQRPSLILCDADTAQAVETIKRLHEVPGPRVDVLFLGEPGRTLDEQVESVQEQSSGSFVRPVDESALLRKVELLIGAPSKRPDSNTRIPPPNRAPVLVAATRRPYRYEASKGESVRPSDEPRSSPAASSPSSPFVAPPASSDSFHSAPFQPVSELPPNSGTSSSPSLMPRTHELPQAKLSPALESLLATAERRVQSSRSSIAAPADRLSPEAELEAILPADVLEALDEPLENDDDDDDSAAGTAGGSDADPGTRGTKTTGAGNTAAPGGRASVEEIAGRRETPAPTSDSQAPESASDGAPQSKRETEPPVTPVRGRRMQSEIPERAVLEAEPSPSRPTNVVGGATAHGVSQPPPSMAAPVDPTQPSTAPPGRATNSPDASRGEATIPPMAKQRLTKLDVPPTLGDGDALRALAQVVRSRYTGALAFEDSAGIRRIVFRDGDFVTAASSADSETLVAFLAQRGDLASDLATRIARKLPPFGRHAGAALIAQGHLRQDELWPVLRAHAEWLIARVATLPRGAASMEAEVPARLQAEPSVFGGATGAEVLIEIARRAVPPADAIARLGGPHVRLDSGPASNLLAECALEQRENDLIREINGLELSEILRRAGSTDIAAVLYALCELSVLARAAAERRPAPKQASPPPADRLDDAALRARILSRRALTEEGDYFALLGVDRNATSYDIRRAYTTLKDELEPTRILTGETVDLRDDVQMILDVLDEAYEILEDDLRRERYRRALEATPR
jgi:hypothetical protein